MPLPNVSDVCVQLDASTGLDIRLGLELSKPLSDFRIRMPGGISIEAKATDGIATVGSVASDLMAQANVALAPFQPIFALIDIALASVKVFNAVKTLSPFKIGEELVKLIAKVDIVAQIIPPLSLPFMILDFIDVLLVLLAALKAQISTMLAAQIRIDAGQAALDDLLAAGSSGDSGALAAAAQLDAALSCARANLAVSLEAMAASSKPLNRLLSLVSGLGSSIGLPEFGPLEVGGSLEVAAVPIDALIAILGTVRAAIPV